MNCQAKIYGHIQMKKLQFLIIIICISLLNTSCCVFQTDAQLIEKFALKVKETSIIDREILNINRPVRLFWCPTCGYDILIYALDDKGGFSKDHDHIYFSFHPPFYEDYTRGGSKAHFGEQFIEQANKKRFNGLALTNFIVKDLIVTLEFSDGSKVIFDRYYKEIEENLDAFRKVFSIWAID